MHALPTTAPCPNPLVLLQRAQPALDHVRAAVIDEADALSAHGKADWVRQFLNQEISNLQTVALPAPVSARPRGVSGAKSSVCDARKNKQTAIDYFNHIRRRSQRPKQQPVVPSVRPASGPTAGARCPDRGAARARREPVGNANTCIELQTDVKRADACANPPLEQDQKRCVAAQALASLSCAFEPAVETTPVHAEQGRNAIAEGMQEGMVRQAAQLEQSNITPKDACERATDSVTLDNKSKVRASHTVTDTPPLHTALPASSNVKQVSSPLQAASGGAGPSYGPISARIRIRSPLKKRKRSSRIHNPASSRSAASSAANSAANSVASSAASSAVRRVRGNLVALQEDDDDYVEVPPESSKRKRKEASKESHRVLPRHARSKRLLENRTGRGTAKKRKKAFIPLEPSRPKEPSVLSDLNPNDTASARGYNTSRNWVPQDFFHQKKVLEALQKLMKRECAEAFLEPVDPTIEGSTYYTIIETPMDLGTVAKRLAAATPSDSFYRNVKEVLEDVNLIWSNCQQFNGSLDPIVQESEKCKSALSVLLEGLPVPLERTSRRRPLKVQEGESSNFPHSHSRVSSSDPINNGQLLGKSGIVFRQISGKKIWTPVTIKEHNPETNTYTVEWVDLGNTSRKVTFGTNGMYPVHRFG